MIHSLFHLSLPPQELVIRGCGVFLYVLILLRIAGKRQMAQMSATEFVAILLISNAVQNAMNGGDNSLAGGLILAGVLIFLSWLISWLTFRYRKARTIFEGTPTLVIHKGTPIDQHLVREHLPRSELMVLLRKQGVHHFSDVHTAVLEADGSLSITRNSEIEH
ncbi:MAG: DUF421 domain-containing protein [Deltaproteobacteria bacterium]|nr:DUF421 domain-containing protein [Deltaproteobacteria bacterium]